MFIMQKSAFRLLTAFLLLCNFGLQSCINGKYNSTIDDESGSADSASQVMNRNESQVEGLNTGNIVISDINNDSIQDSIFITPPIVNDSNEDNPQDCNGPCITKVSFGNTLPPIYIQQSLGGEVKVLDDINEDGYNELVFFPYWFQSCWSRMDVFSFSNQKWNLVRSIDYNSCDETLPTSFEKIDKGLVRVTTNGAQFDDNADEIEKSETELPGLEAKIYDVEIK